MDQKYPTIKQQVWDFVEKWPIYRKDVSDPLLYLDDDKRGDLQNRLLREQLRWLDEGSKFYQRKFKELRLSPEDIRTIEDLERVPLTYKQEYMQCPEDFLLTFKNPTIYDHLWQVTYTTGTTTGRPSPFYSTTHDYYAKLLQCRRRSKVAMMTPEDMQLSIMPIGALPHIAFYGVYDNTTAIHGPGIMTCVGTKHPQFDIHNTMDYAIEAIRQYRPTILYSLTSYARQVLMRAQEKGEDFSSVRIIIAAGEPCSQGLRDDLRGRFAALGAKNVFVTNSFACTELQGSLPECCEFSGCHNSSPDLFYLEVVDENGKRLADGQQGLLALTHLNRRGTALLRYVTGDLATLSREVCPCCGRPGERLIATEGSSYAIRTKDLIKVKGTLINPAVIMEVLAGKPQIEEYQVIIGRKDPKDPYSPDRMVIRIATSIEEKNTFADQIVKEIKNISEVKPEIEFAAAKEIYNPEVVTKAIRFVDQRPKVT